MELYRIMLVDDEVAVREGMVNRIKWEELGFQMVAEAENGEEALEKVESLDVDVILTDIKMPFMDGITLGERLAKERPSIKLIFLTGFDEFEYAKEAIRLKAIDYILKPVNSAELSEMLTKVKSLLDKEIEEKRNLQMLEKHYIESLPLRKIQFLHEVLSGALSTDEINSRIKLYDMSLNRGTYKTVTIFDISTMHREEELKTRELINVSVKNIVEEYFQGKCYYEAFISLSTVIVISSWKENPIGELMNIAEEICNSCKKILDVSITAGIGRAYKQLQDIAKAYKESKAAIEYKYILGEDRVIYIKDMESLSMDEATFDNIMEKKLLMAVKFGPIDYIEEVIDEIINNLKAIDETEGSYNSYLLGILNSVFKIIKRHKLDEYEILGDRTKWLFMLSEQCTIEMLKNRLLNICLGINTHMQEIRITNTKRIVEEAKQYIEDNYYQSDLSVERVCSKIHISKSYFSTIFKKETGLNYIQYLTDVRLSKALELLKETDEKTYVIAQKVGYEEPNYFRYVFKKKYKVSPTSYRK